MTAYFVAAVYHERRTFDRKRPGDRLANASGAARDERPLPLQPQIHVRDLSDVPAGVAPRSGGRPERPVTPWAERDAFGDSDPCL
jgi:hypothetical protein